MMEELFFYLANHKAKGYSLSRKSHNEQGFSTKKKAWKTIIPFVSSTYLLTGVLKKAIMGVQYRLRGLCHAFLAVVT